MPGWFGGASGAVPSEDAAPADQQPAAAGDGGAPSASTTPAPAGPRPGEDMWQVNKPVERRCQAMNEENAECLGLFWRWVTCGGPGGRVSQLYINGKLSPCMFEFRRLRNCMASKLDPNTSITLLPGPHPLWRIRTRKEAAAFWGEQYEHLGARRAAVFGGEDGGQLADIQRME